MYKSPQDEEYFTISETAAALGMPTISVWRSAQTGVMPVISTQGLGLSARSFTPPIPKCVKWLIKAEDLTYLIRKKEEWAILSRSHVYLTADDAVAYAQNQGADISSRAMRRYISSGALPAVSVNDPTEYVHLFKLFLQKNTEYLVQLEELVSFIERYKIMRTIVKKRGKTSAQ